MALFLACVKWCEDSHLQLNITKTKVVATDFRKNVKSPEPVRIQGQVIEQVQSYIYLGTIIDCPNLKENSKAVSRKGQQQMFCLSILSGP